MERPVRRHRCTTKYSIASFFPLCMIGRREGINLMDTGVYFGMPLETYLADPALDQTGIKHLSVSPLTFWANTSRNPDWTPTQTVPQQWGHAYHAAILEGLDAYEAQYRVRPEKSDEYLITADDLRTECSSLGLSRSGTKLEMTERLKEAGHKGPFWDDIKAEHDADPRIEVSAELDHAVRFARKLVERHKDIAPALEGGASEVSVFWRDPEHDVPLKARIDYLTPGWLVDLKTFSNPREIPIARLLPMIIAERKYYLQWCMYLRAFAALPDMGLTMWHDAPGWMPTKFADPAEPQFIFLFIGTDVPHVRARGMTKLMQNGDRSMMWQKAEWDVEAGIRMFAECCERYGDDIWADIEPIKSVEDVEFPMYALE